MLRLLLGTQEHATVRIYLVRSFIQGKYGRPEEGTKTLEFPPLTSSMPPVLSKPCKVHNVVRGIEKLFKKHPPSFVYMICQKLSYGTYQNSIYKSTKI